MEHPFSVKWVLWAHLPHNIDWSLASYIPVMTISYAEELITLLNTLPDKLITSCMLFLMREGVQPMWEDVNNKNGGCFSYKIMNKQVPELWKELCYCVAGNSLTQDQKFNSMVMGLSISPKKSFCIIKVWMGTCVHQDPVKINSIKNLKNSGCIFKKH